VDQSGVAAVWAPTTPVSRSPSEHAREVRGYSIPVPPPAPVSVRFDVEIGREAGGYWASAPELDLTAEGVEAGEAFLNLIHAIRDWLGYIQEERPPLSEELAAQARYVALLDAPLYSWFRGIRFIP
jgi:hypothetical protein